MDRSKTTKKVILVLMAIGLLIGLLVPILAFAQPSKSTAACSRIGQFNSRSSDQLQKQTDKLTQNREARQSKLEDNQSSRAQRILDHRAKFDQSREKHLAHLRKRATNENQTAAISQFEKDVKDAVEVRRTAVDAARVKFAEGVKTAVDSRRTALNNALTGYKSTVNAAITKAVADCAAGSDASTVRSELQSSIRDAKEDFRQARTDAEKVGPTVSTLTKERREAVQKARDDFKKTVEAARDKLKDALGVRAE